MPMDQEPQVATGLAGLQAPAPTPSPIPAPTAEAVPEAALAALPNPGAPVQIAGLADDLTAKVPEINQVAQEAVQQFQLADQRQAENENKVRDFMGKLAAAKRPEDTPYVPPPIPLRIAEQTRKEMETGAARVAEFEAQQAARPRARPETDRSMTPVFRPADFVPDQKKGQGNLASASARTL